MRTSGEVVIGQAVLSDGITWERVISKEQNKWLELPVYMVCGNR